MKTDQDTQVDQLKQLVATFCDLRGWRKNAKPADLAISISLECSELLEHFQWSSGLTIDQIKSDQVEYSHIKHELADILIYALLFADRLNIDLTSAIQNKLVLNEKKYPLKLFKSKKMDLKQYKKIKQSFRTKQSYLQNP